mgnify:CR=1 FL=1
MERPYEQIRRMVKLFEYNRLKLRFRNEDERARFIDGWAEHFCETDDAEWNIAVTIMTAAAANRTSIIWKKPCVKRRA